MAEAEEGSGAYTRAERDKERAEAFLKVAGAGGDASALDEVRPQPSG